MTAAGPQPPVRCVGQDQPPLPPTASSNPGQGQGRADRSPDRVSPARTAAITTFGMTRGEVRSHRIPYLDLIASATP